MKLSLILLFFPLLLMSQITNENKKIINVKYERGLDSLVLKNQNIINKKDGILGWRVQLTFKSTKEEIKQALKNKEEAVKEEETVDEFAKLQEILRLDDKSIMVEELKARGFAESEIEDYVDRLEDAGTLKYEALKVKNDIRKHIVDQEAQAKAKEEADQKEKAKQVEENKLALQKTIKEREDFYGYNLGKEQKKEVYNYITSGEFYKDLSASHEEVFEQAMFKLFQERVFDLQSKKGYEDGKSQILDNITSPDLGRTSKPRPMSAKGFDPSQFSKS